MPTLTGHPGVSQVLIMTEYPGLPYRKPNLLDLKESSLILTDLGQKLKKNCANMFNADKK